MTTIVEIIYIGLLLPISLLSVYQWVLAVISLVSSPGAREGMCSSRNLKFIVLIPAHDEEHGLPDTIMSLKKLNYPPEFTQIIVVADHCDDATAAVARRCGAECLERHEGQGGKGTAIAWAIQKIKAAEIAFDALVIIDADAVAHHDLLDAFNRGLQVGQKIQQGYNYISNPWQSPFTRIVAVTGILKNRLFYGGRAQLGLSCMLTGTGMCFSQSIVERYGWTAFSIGEDWEFSASLLLAGEMIHFNPAAMVLAKESANLKQASRQRLRWASGRYAVMNHSAWPLFVKGIKERRLSLVEAALTLIFPNYSSQASLSILGFLGAWGISSSTGDLLLSWATMLILSLMMYFLLGVLLTKAPLKTLAGIPLIPIFLIWRLVIEVLGLLGRGRKHWGRKSRSPVSRRSIDH